MRKRFFLLKLIIVLLLSLVIISESPGIYYWLFWKAEHNLPKWKSDYRLIATYQYIMQDQHQNIYIMDQGGNILRLDSNGNKTFFPLSYFSYTKLGISENGELLLIAKSRSGNLGAYYYDAEGRYLKKVEEFGAETYALCLPTSISETSDGVNYQIKNSIFVSKVAAVWEEGNVKKEKTLTWAFPKNTSYALAILCQVILLIITQRKDGKVQRRKCNKA